MNAYFGAVDLLDAIVAPASINSQWKLVIRVYRTGANTQRVVTEWTSTTTTGSTIYQYLLITDSATESDSGAIVLAVKGEGVADDDVQIYTALVEGI